MFLEQDGLAIGLNRPRLLVPLLSFYFVIRYGVIGHEEVYLERNFDAAYLDYKFGIRRWL